MECSRLKQIRSTVVLSNVVYKQSEFVIHKTYICSTALVADGTFLWFTSSFLFISI